MPYVMFSKHLQEFSIAEAAKRIKALGFNGIDLTVRPGGHLEPEAAPSQLKQAVQTIQDRGLTIPMITTAITSAATPHAESVLAAAAEQGIYRVKLGYWNTRPGHLRQAIDSSQQDLDSLAPLAARHGVTLAIHNHSGPGYVNCMPAVIWMLLKDRDPNQIGAYFDPGHAALEGADGGWRQSFELLSPYLRMVAVKNFALFPQPGDPETTWKSQLVPLSQGLVPWSEFFTSLRRLQFDGPISFHSEYQGGHSWKDLTTSELIDQTAIDLAFITSLDPKP